MGGFGFSKIYDFFFPSMNFNSTKGRIKGTPIYMAPEVLSDCEYSKSSDVYSFAFTVLNILDLKYPYKNMLFFQLFKKVIKKERPEVSECVPDAFKNLIKRCWSQDPKDRPSFSEIVDDLRSNKEYITDLVDESEFYSYVEYLDEFHVSFDTSNLIHYKDFINPPKNIPSRPINTAQIYEGKIKKDIKEEFNGIFFDSSIFKSTKKKVENEMIESVFIGKDGKQYLIKPITSGLETAKSQQLFVNEAINLKKLNQHPSIINFYGINFHSLNDSKIYEPTVLTEYIPTDSLRSLFTKLKKNANIKGWNATKKIINLLGISHAIMFAHNHNQAHLNLKPENIILDKNFYPKVRDFGKTMSRKNEVTFYTAPEVFKDKEASSKEIDVYSFAIIAYEIIAETEPFSKNRKPLKISFLEKKITNEERPDFNHNFTKSMKELISLCWSNDPKKRPTFDQIYAQLSSNYKSYTTDKINSKEIDSYITLLNKFNESLKTKSHDDDNCFFGVDDEENFETICAIGESMTSFVFKIIDKRTKVPMCKKVLKTKGVEFKDFQNAIKEFQVLHTLNHPCICKAIAINTSEVLPETTSEGDELITVALLLEFIDFKLKDFLENNMLNNTLKTRIIVEIAHGIRYIHSKGMIYRDISIDNVMLNSVFQVKLINFGLVKIDECLLGEETMNSITMTKGVGDAVFMSPEMMEEADYDNKTDVYSFGILIFYIFVGKLPKQTIKDIMMKKHIKLPDESKFISAACIELISKCLQEDPNQRPSFDQILEFIRDNKYMLASDVDPSIVSQRDQELELVKNS